MKLRHCPICGELIDEFDIKAKFRHMAVSHRIYGLRPMAEFDPNTPAMVHDRLNDNLFEWLPTQFSSSYRAEETNDGVVEWDGLLLDGWLPLKES